MNIQKVPYGLNKNAIKLDLIWGVKPFFDESLKLEINLIDEENNLIETLKKEMTMVEYLAYGVNKEERANAIVVKFGFVILVPEDLTI